MSPRSLIVVTFSMICIFIFACKQKESTTPDFKYEYFPVNTGHYVIYQVDSTYYDDFTHTVLDYSYQIKETIVEEFKDNAGRPTQRIERSVRKSSSDNWNVINEWAANRTLTNAERTENNIKFLKLKFPPKKGANWNGNIYNGQDEWDYEITELDATRDINGLHFDKTLSITQTADTSNLIYYKLFTESYGMSAGLIEKNIIDVESNSSTIQPGIPVLNRITKGYKVTYKIIDYGN